jgi:hypothetical protein
VDPSERSTPSLIEHVHRLHQVIARHQRALVLALAELERREAWEDDGAHDMTHWTAMRLDTSQWRAGRWLAAGRALPGLPAISHAFERGQIGIDKVAELARYATFDDEDAYLAWAQEVSLGAVRRRGELQTRMDADADQETRDRWTEWRYLDEGRRFALEAQLPAADGALVAETLQRLGDRIPVMPGEDGAEYAGMRRADALVALCQAGDPQDGSATAGGPTMVVHAQWDTLLDAQAAQIEDGPAIDAETARRLMCDARVQTVVEDADGTVIGQGRAAREPSPALMRQLRYRDDACRFPGCGHRRFTQAHHIRWWSRGGRTELENLVLICSFHHRLVHEHGWSIHRTERGEIRWVRPDGQRYRAGPTAA